MESFWVIVGDISQLSVAVITGTAGMALQDTWTLAGTPTNCGAISSFT